MLTITTWLWGKKYNESDVVKLRIGLQRHLVQPHRLICVTDNAELQQQDGYAVIPYDDHELIEAHSKSCFARLRLFDPDFQEMLGVEERLVNLDLDTVIVGELDPLFANDADFMILQGANAVNPCPYNGSMFMIARNAHPEVWDEFSLTRAETIPHFFYPDDQGWIHYVLKDAKGWKAGTQGVYAFHKPGWPSRTNDLPPDARIVFFPGGRTVADYKQVPWIYDNWTSLYSSQRT